MRFGAASRTRQAFAEAVTKALHRFGVSQAQGAPDADETCSRARALLEHGRDSSEALIALAIAAGPRQTILRPAEIENLELARWVLQALLFGPNAVFDGRQGNDHQTDAQTLEITQQRGAGGRDSGRRAHGVADAG